MDFMANKALLIAVAIFITLAITSGVFMIINNIQQIYGEVYETDTSITSRFGEFDKYDGGVFLGIDVVNTYNKYKDDNRVEVYFKNNKMNDKTITEDKYSKEYKSEIRELKNGVMRITFK